MSKLTTFKYAFSMLELIFVIVILGIVSSVGASIIANVYESYIIQRAVHDASVRTELAINQLANRLTYRIDESMLARRPDGFYTAPPTADPSIYRARELPYDKRNSHTALEWIGYDNDNFSAYANPTWSGFADLTSGAGATTTTNLYTPGSDTSQFTNHYNGADRRAILFKGTSNYLDDGINIQSYGAACMYNSNGCIFPVTIGGTQQLTMGTAAGDGNRVAGAMVYTEFYQLADSAFAVVPDNSHTLANTSVTVHDLRLYYGYQPWKDEAYNTASSAILLKDVSVFRFRKEKNAIRIKLCTVERIGDQETISICKEKAVIR